LPFKCNLQRYILASIVPTFPPQLPVSFTTEASRLTFVYAHFMSFARFTLPWRNNTSFGVTLLLSTAYYAFIMACWYSQAHTKGLIPHLSTAGRCTSSLYTFTLTLQAFIFTST
jgi:hypothetical protein